MAPRLRILTRASEDLFNMLYGKMACDSPKATIHAIYHSPYSTKNQSTNPMFLDDLTEHLTTSKKSRSVTKSYGNYSKTI